MLLKKFGSVVVSSSLILSSVVSFAGASAQENLDMRGDSLDLSKNYIYLNEDMQAAPSLEYVQDSNKDETPLAGGENDKGVDLENSLNSAPNTRLAELEKTDKKVIKDTQNLPLTSITLGTVAAAGVGSSIYLKNKNNNLKEIVKDLLETSYTNNYKKENESDSANLQKLLNVEEEKNREIEDLKDKLAAESDKCNQLQEKLNSSKWGLGSWLLILFAGHLASALLATIFQSVYLIKRVSYYKLSYSVLDIVYCCFIKNLTFGVCKRGYIEVVENVIKIKDKEENVGEGETSDKNDFGSNYA